MVLHIRVFRILFFNSIRLNVFRRFSVNIRYRGDGKDMAMALALFKKTIILVFFICLLFSAFGQTVSEVPIITVLDFVSEDVSRSEVRLVVSMLSTSIYKMGRFKVIDISQRDNMMKELAFSISGCSDESCQLELGRMLAAELIVVGHLGKLGTRYVLSSKILETSTGATFGAEDGVYSNIDSLVDNLDSFVRSLASDVLALMDSKAGTAGKVAQAVPVVPQEPGRAETKPAEKESPEDVPGSRVKREPREKKERPVRPVTEGAFSLRGTLALAGGIAAVGIGGLDLIHAGWSGTEQLKLSGAVYSSAETNFNNTYLGYLADYSSRIESALWGIGWTAGGAALAGYGLYLSLSGVSEENIRWRELLLAAGGTVSLLQGARLLTEAGGSLSKKVEASSAAYSSSDSNFDSLYSDYQINLAIRNSSFVKGLLFSVGGLGSLGAAIGLNILTEPADDFHWPGFLLLAGGAGALAGSAHLFSEAAGPLTLAVNRSASAYLGSPEDYDSAYRAYKADFGKRSAALWSGIGLGTAGLGLAGLGIWQYFFTPPPQSSGNWQGWTLAGSGGAVFFWGLSEILIAALSLTPDTETAREAYSSAEDNFDLLYGAYRAAYTLRNETFLKGLLLTGAGAAAGIIGAVRLSAPVKQNSDFIPLSLRVVPQPSGWSIVASCRW